MTLFKCKMCGANLEFTEGATVAKCKYCGTTQTLPRLTNDKRANLYDRANHFRRNNEFDKAMAIYENILNEDGTDAEAYWSLVLCRYGIEYVLDPASKQHIPTVNRTQYTSIYDDDNYRSALQYADEAQRKVMEAEAKRINEIQKNILTISQSEKPFDVFICYKETDKDGKRTRDSVLAQELYDYLKEEGFQVFFSRITLEDKLGTAYEPYIFAALNSAKVMVVLGTCPEFFNAAWVKNEWSRYLALIKQGQKKVLIPAYRDMDPYELPEEFSHLQAQDMAKLGFMQDLIRSIRKILDENKPKVAPVIPEQNTSAVLADTARQSDPAALLSKAFALLAKSEWSNAAQQLETVLDIDPENAQAYLGKLMVEMQVSQQALLGECHTPLEENLNYRRAVRFADPALRATLEEYAAQTAQRGKATSKNKNLRGAKKKRGLILIPLTSLLLIGGFLLHTFITPKSGQHDRTNLPAATSTQAIDAAASTLEITTEATKATETAEEPTTDKAKTTESATESTTAATKATEAATETTTVTTAIPEETAAEPAESYSEGFLYTSYGREITIKGIGSCTDTEIRIPPMIDNKFVVKIDTGAFANLTSVVSIEIPDGVREIGQNAFKNCPSLTTLILPQTLLSFERALDGLPNAVFHTDDQGGLYLGTADNPYFCLHSLSNPDVTAYTTHPNTKLVHANAFAEHSKITDVTFTEGVWYIGTDTFANCTQLTTVALPSTLKSIFGSIFGGCVSLTEVRLTEENPYYTASEGCIIDTRDHHLVVALGDTVPEGVRSIPGKAFHRFPITQINLPSTLKSIGFSAFAGCRSLKKINFAGTIAQWETVSKGNTWNSGMPSYTVYCSDGIYSAQ